MKGKGSASLWINDCGRSSLYIIVAGRWQFVYNRCGEVHLGVCFSSWRGPLQYKRGLIPSRVTSKSSKKRGRKSLSESYYFLKKKSQKITFLRVNRLRDISWLKGGYFVSEIVNFGKKRKLFSLFVVF